METWILILISSLPIIAFFKFLSKKTKSKLPPGPSPLPFLGNTLLLRKNSSIFFTFLQQLLSEYGPIITLYFGSRPVIFISDQFLAHQALIQNGAVFSDRPPAVTTTRILYSNYITIFSAFHGPNWNLLRRNLISEILNPSRLRLLSDARKRSLDSLIKSLKSQSQSGAPVLFLDHFRPMIMCLSVFMCFGFKLDEKKKIDDLSNLLHRVLMYSSSQNKLNMYPVKLSKFLFPKLWKELLMLRKEIEDTLIPLIKARYEQKQLENDRKNKEERISPYLDTLIDLHLPEEKRKLEEGEIISLCAEFLNGIVHSTLVVIQWTMANIVKYQDIQEKLYAEISGVLEKSKEDVVLEDDLKNMPYLKAVILETLRRHPPGYLALPHAVTEEVLLDGKYVIPKKVTVHFVASEMAKDEKVWEDPMTFRPERFLTTTEDVEEVLTGNKEIKYMPFGGGRRICPGISVSMLHLQYFVSNLVRSFKWEAVSEVDLEEKLEVSITMKTTLQAYISARSKEEYVCE